MKKITKLLTAFLIMLFSVPVFAEDGVTIENIIGTTLNENVVLNATDKIDVAFNDLNQDASYKVTLKNNTDEVVYVNDVVVENLSEEFIEFSLTNKSLNTLIEPGKENVVEVEIKTLDITHAGRNVNKEVTLKFLLGDSVVNPETSANWIVYVFLIGTLLITISTMFSKLDKKKKLSIFVIGTLVLGTTVVSANDDNTLSLTGKVKYTSQNLLQESGTKLDGYKVSYVDSVEIWKYAEQVKNIIISDNKTKPEEYECRYDLTTTGSKRIYGYLVENGNSKTPYDLYIVSNGVMYAPANSTGLFSFPNVETIKGIEYVEFDNTTNMSAMFMNNEKLKNLNTSAINTSNVTNTSYMFNGCDNLNVSEKNFNLAKVTNKTYMFNQNLNDIVKKYAISDKNVDFASSAEARNYMVESTKNSENPIYYYRGPVANNNVIFANFCWKIVRTTETGGTKLIYNGVPNNNRCYNSGTSSRIGTSAFNSQNKKSLSAVGYMYGKSYTALTKNLSSQSNVYLYGNDIIWTGTEYKLIDTKESDSWPKDRTLLASKYHYTCFNETGVCQQVYYIHYFGDSANAYYFTLSNGLNIEDAKNEMFENKNNSTIKNIIDNWYKQNMTSYTEQLEDTVWCNDRSITIGTLKNKDTDGSNSFSYFISHEGKKNARPNLNCQNKNDKFTVNADNGNGALKYPVGLLTVDEYTLAGSGLKSYSASSYLYTGQNQWTASPMDFYNGIAHVSAAQDYAKSTITDNSADVRPSISMKKDIRVITGNGSSYNPYIVE